MSSPFIFAPAFKYTQVGCAKVHQPLSTKKRKRRSDAVSADARLEEAEEDGPGRLVDADGSQAGHPNSNDRGDKLDPPLDDEESSSDRDFEASRNRPPKSTGIRKQHLAVLVAVLHQCLLTGDYVRAGRAWGMLLRTDLNGHPMDLRAHGRWGIGAEILLYRDKQLNQRQRSAVDGMETNSHLTPDQDERITDAASTFSQDGFEKAKDYYERLILQYPYRKTMPNAISSLDFYPAMFSLCIYAIQDQHKQMLNTPRPEHMDVGPDPTAGDDPARRAAFQSTSEIAARLDELLVSPPYSDHSRLWHLRGTIALWMADLSYADDSSGLSSDRGSSSSEYERPTDHQIVNHKRPDHDFRQQQRLDARAKAQEAFDNVARLGTSNARRAELA